MTPEMQDLAVFCVYVAHHLGIGQLHKLRKQLNLAFPVSYYVFSILIMSFNLASKSRKCQFRAPVVL